MISVRQTFLYSVLQNRFVVLFLYRFVFLFYRSLIGAHVSGFALEDIICQRRISQRRRDRNADKRMTSVALSIFCHYVCDNERGDLSLGCRARNPSGRQRSCS